MPHPAIITAYFADKSGDPALGLGPGICIFEVTSTVGSPQSDTLVIGTLGGSPIAPLTEIGKGFYKYVFTGYDSTRKYAYQIDGEAAGTGPKLGLGRVVVGTNENFAEDISHQVWEEPQNLHLTGSPETMGSVLSNIITFTETLLKAQYNRTVLDKAAFTLTIFDNDGVTPIRVFDLRELGVGPSIDEITERLPVAGSPLTP
jgi:hypothetical protein